MEQADARFWSLNTALAGAGALVLVGIIYGAHVFSKKTEGLARAVADVAVAEVKLNGVYVQVLEAESSQRGYLVTGDAGYLEPFRDAREKTAENLDAAARRLGRLDVNARETGLADMRESVAQKFVELDKTLALAQAGRRDAALDVVRSNRGRDLMSRIRDLTNAELDRLSALRRIRLAELRDSAGTLTALNLLGSIAIFVLAGLAVAQLARHSRALNLAQQKLAAANDALEARVAERTRDLNRANEEIQRYAYIVSHDLRAPLVNIIGFARELETSAASLKPLVEAPGFDRDDPAAARAAEAVNADIPEALKFIRSSTTRMDALIAGILKLSRLGGLTLQPQPVDLDQLARDCVATVQHRVNDAGAQVEIEGRLPTVIGDRNAISQVLSNLLDNAAKYLSAARPGRIVLRARKTAARTLVEVEDNGRGVAAKDQARIFELFRRAGTQDQPGDGIGLAHVRTLARRMGGDILVRSDGQSGSVFTVTLPNDLRDILSQDTRQDTREEQPNA
jgi:signal transduction histidine kinase